MTEYQVGSLGNLISGSTDSSAGTKIVYQKIAPKVNPTRILKQSTDGLLTPKTKGSSTLHEKGRKLKEKIASSLLKKNKPEIAGDNEHAVGKSWKLMPDREDTSEADGTYSHKESAYSYNAARRIHIKKNTKKHVDEPERELRTIFVGNIPYAHAKKKKLIKFFSQYGNVESIRFRCAPVKDPRMSKKVAVIKQEFHPERSSICAFVVFKTVDEAKTALEANGSVYHDHHLRVDMAGSTSKKDVDPKRSVFVGNVAFSAEEEDLWKIFSTCGTIESVRIIRDPLTAVSKGVAFVNFEESDAAELALQLDGETLRKRSISVRRHRPNAKSSSEKSSTEKVIRHKRSEPSDGKSRDKENSKAEIRMKKKEKRKMRREGEALLGIVKKRKKTVKASETSKPETDETIQEKTKPLKAGTKTKFQGQTVEDSRKKKKKVNKGELKKKKVANLLGASLQKKKKKA